MTGDDSGVQPPSEDQPFEADVPDLLDRETAKKVSALFANRIYVQPVGDGLVRLTFGEIWDAGDEPVFHTALIVSARNAAAFAELIHQIATALIASPEMVRTDAPGPPESGSGV